MIAMYIQRHAQAVITRIARRKAVLVITGARQVGKSTMLKEVFRDIHYVALDSPLVRQSAKDNPSIFLPSTILQLSSMKFKRRRNCLNTSKTSLTSVAKKGASI
jgi:predicted AAA+ superfamily ATPase